MSSASDDRQLIRDAQLANMRQELLAPVGAIVGYGEIVREAAQAGDLDEIGEDARWRELPVVVMTAKTLTGEDRDRLSGRVAQLVEKSSYDLDALLGDLEAVLQRAAEPGDG